MADPTDSSIWDENFLGGNGAEADDWRVASRPFAFGKGNSPIPEGHDGTALRRRFGALAPTLPTAEDLALAMGEAFYDTPSFSNSPCNITFKEPEALIEFGAVEREGRPAYYVRDNGVGFDEAYAEGIFDPFRACAVGRSTRARG